MEGVKAPPYNGKLIGILITFHMIFDICGCIQGFPKFLFLLSASLSINNDDYPQYQLPDC